MYQLHVPASIRRFFTTGGTHTPSPAADHVEGGDHRNTNSHHSSSSSRAVHAPIATIHNATVSKTRTTRAAVIRAAHGAQRADTMEWLTKRVELASSRSPFVPAALNNTTPRKSRAAQHGVDSVFDKSLRNNVDPQMEPDVRHQSAAMQLLRVALCHLRAIGALSYVVDIRYHPTHAIVLVSSGLLHDSLRGVPATLVRVFPALSRSGRTALSHAKEVLTFPPVDPIAAEKDVVITFAVPEGVDVGNAVAGGGGLPRSNGWEPSFLEESTLFRANCGAACSFELAGMSRQEASMHRAAMDSQDVASFLTFMQNGVSAAVLLSASGGGRHATSGTFDSMDSRLVVHKLTQGLVPYQHGDMTVAAALSHLERFTFSSFGATLAAALVTGIRRSWFIESLAAGQKSRKGDNNALATVDC